jgi:four helix bundle protein
MWIVEWEIPVRREARRPTRNRTFTLQMKEDLETRTKRFGLSIIELVGKLPHSKASDVVGYQLLKSGTSIGANYREANRARSRDDFIHKVGICKKETSETEYWLDLAPGADLIAASSI